MTSFVLTVFCFLVSFSLHILLRKHMALIIAYVAGACMLIVLGWMGLIRIPWSSGCLFLLLSCTSILLYIATSLGTELPTSIILGSFKKKKKQSLADLTGLFTDKGLILDRLENLVQSGLVVRSGKQLTITGRGKIVRNVMELYKLIFSRRLTE